jgi:hypothetical protein
MRSLIFGASALTALALLVGVAPGCGSDDGGGTATPDGGGGGGDGECVGFGCTTTDGGKPGCTGLECQQVTCEGGGTTSLSGTVFDPAGKVPVYNATVYVPNAPLTDLPTGASCDRCDAKVSGNPVVITATGVDGKFKLDNVPVGVELTLVVQIGKWRRAVKIPAAAKCVDTPIDAGSTRLPKNRTEGNIPRIAVTTGAADPLQCLLRKIGVEDSEFGIAGSDARIHLYQGGGYDSGGPKLASSKFAGGATFPTAQSLWDDTAATNLKKYDVVMMGCEGGELEGANAGCPTCSAGAEKSQVAKTAMYDYAKAGGRIFASHYHYVWFSKTSDAAVSGVASWANPEQAPPAFPSNPSTTAVNADISAAFPKAQAMSQWLTAQNALVGGKLPILDARHNINGVSTNALSWITAKSGTVAAPNDNPVQYMSFNAPIGADDTAVCGRVVLNNIHVAAGADDPLADFPTGCNADPLTAQQKALEFMLFDLSSCVQKDDAPIQPPR